MNDAKEMLKVQEDFFEAGSAEIVNASLLGDTGSILVLVNPRKAS